MKSKDIRSLRKIDWHPGNLNVLIGPNGSGKSNLLRTLEMLSVAANGGLGTYVQREGGMEPLVWDGNDDRIRVRCKLSPAEDWRDFERDSYTYELTLGRLGKSSTYRIDSELLGNFYQVETHTAQRAFQAVRTRPPARRGLRSGAACSLWHRNPFQRKKRYFLLLRAPSRPTA